MAAMNVIVHSSITPEPFARVILEAMAMGKPVVAMNEGGVPEVIKDGVNGISIPPKNASLMARKIIGLLSDRDMAKKMGQAARKCIEEHFSIEENVKKIQKEYLQILKV
jgi:glycosyltransferase involved in cell wall biosynthesis